MDDIMKQGQLPGSLELAYLGDTLWDLMVRTRLVRQGGTMKTLHRAAVAREAYLETEGESLLDRLCNHSIREFVRAMYDGERISPEELEDLRRYIDEVAGK